MFALVATSVSVKKRIKTVLAFPYLFDILRSNESETIL